MALAARGGRGECQERQIITALQHVDGPGDGLGRLPLVGGDAARSGQCGIGGILRGLHVGLVERVDPHLGTSGCDGEFQGHVERTHVQWLSQVEHEHRDARCADGGNVGVELARQAQVQDDAVEAVLTGITQGLVGNGDDALALFAQTLGHQLFCPQTERADAGVGHDRQLVAPGTCQGGQRDPEPGTVGAVACGLGTIEHRRDGHARERHGNETEQREGREAPTDVGQVLGDHAPALVRGADGQGGSRISDGHKAVAEGVAHGVLHPLTHVRGEGQRFRRGAAFRRHDGKAALRVHTVGDCRDGDRVGGVEDAQLNATRVPECAAGHLG